MTSPSQDSPSHDSPPEDSPASKYRWVAITLIVGLAVFRWWQQQEAADRPNAPVNVAENAPIKAAENGRPKRAEHSATDIESSAKPGQSSAETPDVVSHNRKVAARDVRAVKETPPKTPPAGSSKQSSPPNKTGPPTVNGLKVENVIVKDRDGEVVFRGTVDLTETLARIDDHRTLSEYRNDGVEFKNFERRLPSKPRGHYREWVHLTPGQRGPGAQRVVTGKTGEAFYTWDHYEHFLRVRSGQ
jgi:filamentous hemagglutinin